MSEDNDSLLHKPQASLQVPSGIVKNRKTHAYGHVSVAQKAVWRTSVLFTGTANSPGSTPHMSMTTGPISIRFAYLMPSIYATLHTEFEGYRPSSSGDMCS